MHATARSPQIEAFISQTAREKIVANYPFFILLSNEDIRELAALLEEKKIAPGTVIVKEGDPIDYIYLIASGVAHVTKEIKKIDEKSSTLELSLIHEGGAIGMSEDGFFAIDGKRSATVTADTEMRLLQISIQKFAAFISDKSRLYPDAAACANKMLQQQLTTTSVSPQNRKSTFFKKLRNILRIR